MRVVSLLPSATEILHAIGGGDLLVGRSHECDHPATISHLPVLSRPRTEFSTSADTHQQISDLLKAGMADSLYHLDASMLQQLQPDVIITQSLCDVCSIDLPAVERAVSELSPQPAIVSLNPTTLDAVLDDHLRVGAALGLERQAGEAVIRLRGRFSRAEEYVNPYADGPVVGYLEWTDPLFIAGHWTVQLIERAGGRHPLNPTVPIPGNGAAVGPQQAAREAGKSIAVEHAVFAATRPEWLVISPCGLNLEQIRVEVDRLRAHNWFNSLPAVQAGRVALVDGNQMFNRPGPRLAEAFEFLVGWLQGLPELIPQGFAWELMDT